ncbi:ankyrin repeat [Stylonychia lemnae]|uniref:Ankyrin repeat n=1 Tax=Stylonychia lemnae TaxID=5949 RepID=A0A078APC7_STYLE|nr:ankyrin repeat [Stylonychia lemnae]|eukprot:CDW83984.1 ankyrin repeat [Stylonychia lemnae]
MPRKESSVLKPLSVQPIQVDQKDYAQMLQQKLDVLIQEREQESQKLLFGIGTSALTNEQQSTETKLMITQRLKGKEKEVNKQSNFDKLIEKQNQRKLKSRGKSRSKEGITGVGTLNLDDEEQFAQLTQKVSIFEKTKSYSSGVTQDQDNRLCLIWRKIGQCPQGDKCPYAHDANDIKYYRPSIWMNLVKSLNEDKTQETDESESYERLTRVKNVDKYFGDIDQACRINNASGVEYLILNGAKFSKDAIFYCVKNRNYEALGSLIKHSIFTLDTGVTYANMYGNILHTACQYANLQILTKLVDTELYDVNLIDKYERSPIFYAVMKDNFEEVKLLISKCSFLDFEDIYGKVLLDYARDVHSEKILGILIDSGENLGKNMCKGVELLFECIQQKWLDLFKSLIKKGVPIASVDNKVKNFFMTDNTGQSIFLKAVIKNDYETVERLLTSKKDSIKVDQQDQENRTALMYACENQNLEILGHHIYDYAKSEISRQMILDYILYKFEGMSKKEKDTLIYQLMQRNNRTESKLSLISTGLPKKKKGGHLKIQEVIDQIDIEYKSQIKAEKEKADEDGTQKIIAEKFLQSKISLQQLTKQALSKPTERMMGKQQLVENYFRTQENKVAEAVKMHQSRRLIVDPQSLAIQLKIERERRTSLTINRGGTKIMQDQNPRHQGNGQQVKQINTGNLTERFPARVVQSSSQQDEEIRTETAASSIFSKIRAMKNGEINMFQDMKQAGGHQSQRNLKTHTLANNETQQTQSSKNFFKQRRASQKLSSPSKRGKMCLMDHLNFKNDTKEKRILMEILDEFKPANRDDFRQECSPINNLESQVSLKIQRQQTMWDQDEIELYTDQQYSCKEINKYFQPESITTTKRLTLSKKSSQS